ncbi:PepSY-like domain-containing protein [Maribacter litopenaei]|uniref:PepSY-like domain-containing protein n=1 Tax=Maribacter litopenaei TaxID=2976127 RepID=A0ABY5Y7H3_9FLAO|nr:PepSY-like domain-containing protein [Maribacter litopenaei]UWX54420.1 PepSY-like domain-containing protein [Maribacter litopenaei]
MKLYKMLFSASLILFTGCSNEAKSQVPDEVKASFKAKYPGENDPDWRRDKNGNFESHFKKDGEHYRADFSPNGSWIETESSIKKKDLPKPIIEVIKSNFDEDAIVEIEKVDHNQKGLFYDVEFKIDGKKKDVEFNKDGKIIN